MKHLTLALLVAAAGCPGTYDGPEPDAGLQRASTDGATADAAGPVTPADGSTAAPPTGPPGCADGDVAFALIAGGVAPCASVDVEVSATVGHAWILLGVRALDEPKVTWHPGSPEITERDKRYRWTYRGVGLPCGDGPYLLHFMADATEGDWTAGKIVASCQLQP